MTPLVQRYTMPPGPSDEWDLVQEVQGHQLATEFAREWTIDHDPKGAIFRLGFAGSSQAATNLGKMLYNHPLVQEKIAGEIRLFAKAEDLDKTTILQLLLAEAQDNSFGSSHGARVRALQVLLTHVVDAEKADLEGDEDNTPQVNIHLHTAPPAKVA